MPDWFSRQIKLSPPHTTLTLLGSSHIILSWSVFMLKVYWGQCPRSIHLWTPIPLTWAPCISWTFNKSLPWGGEKRMEGIRNIIELQKWQWTAFKTNFTHCEALPRVVAGPSAPGVILLAGFCVVVLDLVVGWDWQGCAQQSFPWHPPSLWDRKSVV